MYLDANAGLDILLKKQINRSKRSNRLKNQVQAQSQVISKQSNKGKKIESARQDQN